jgi:DNA (cytosine-5)-methyltransferase 1
MARIIHEVRPRFVFVENSPMLTSRGLGTVLGDLASMGFDARWGVLGAADVGAPHQRDRIWIKAVLADPKKLFCDGSDDNARICVERKQVPESRDGSRKKNVSDTNGFIDAMRGDSQDHAESMVRRGDEPRGSICNSGTGCQEGSREGSGLADTDSAQCQRNERTIGIRTQHPNIGGTSWWEVEPDVGRVADGVAARVDRLKAIGNGQVPEVARTAWENL